MRIFEKFGKTISVPGHLVGALAYSCTNFPNAVCIFSLTFFQKAKARLVGGWVVTTLCVSRAFIKTKVYQDDISVTRLVFLSRQIKKFYLK